MKKIKLWKNQKELSDKVALVDDEDYERVVEAIRSKKTGKPGKWYAHGTGRGKSYVYAYNGSRSLAMHRVVMDTPKGMDTDHVNGQTLDNRKENLRVCTRSQNCQNKKLRCDSASGFKGVDYRNTENLAKPYRAYIGVPESSGKSIYLGWFETAEEAALAYDEKAIELFGEYAHLNFPDRCNL